MCCFILDLEVVEEVLHDVGLVSLNVGNCEEGGHLDFILDVELAIIIDVEEDLFVWLKNNKARQWRRLCLWARACRRSAP